MPESTASSQVRADDILYRKVNPEHWDQQTGEVFPEAFRDNYDAQSFYVARLSNAEDVLRRFATLPFARRLCDKIHPTTRDLYDRGYTVARVPAASAINLELAISEINEKGHVDVTAARDHALDFAEASTVLREDEIFLP